MSNKLAYMKRAVFFASQSPDLLAELLDSLVTNVVTRVKVSGDLTVTKGGSDVTKTYTTKIYSQYDDEMSGTITYSLVGTLSGVSINSSTGVLTVTSSATTGSIGVKATVGSVNNTLTVTIN